MLINSTKECPSSIPLAKDCPPSVAHIPGRLHELAISLKELREEINDINSKLSRRKKLYYELDRERINLQIQVWEGLGRITKLPTIVPKSRKPVPTTPLHPEELIISLDSMSSEARESLIHSLLESRRKEESASLHT